MKIFAGCFSGILGICLILVVIMIMIGPWCLQYDLNHWLPIIHRAVPSINNVAPVHMSLILIIVGLMLFECAVPIAIVTAFLFGLGIIG